MITSFQVSNYRQFEDLTVEGLKRLNLIVGENSVGKSSLLEAIWLHVNEGNVDALRDILAMRGEIAQKGLYASHPDDLARSPLSTLTPWPPKKGKEPLSWKSISTGGEDQGEIRYRINLTKYRSGISTYSVASDGWQGILLGVRLSELKEENINWTATEIPLPSLEAARTPQLMRQDRVFVPASGLTPDFVRDFWDKVSLTEHEDDVDEAVQLLEPKVQRISMSTIGPMVKLKGAPAPVPLSRLGEGMSRLFALALAMVNAKGGVLLIDEIEVGLHRATLDRMWPFLFILAERFDVQLFATTHSWDCISSFAATAKERDQDEAALIRLERNKKGKVVSIHYDARTLATATEQGIEVR